MATGTAAAPWTVADLAEQFGPIPARRIRSDPPPGEATERDVLKIHRREKRLYELVDGVLVEKDMGYKESSLAFWLGTRMQMFLDRHDLGILAGADGMIRLAPGLIRIPDISFVAWDRVPGRQIPEEPIPDLAPNLAIEIFSKGNTKEEMVRKLTDYFAAGVDLVWFVDPKTQTVTVYGAPNQFQVLSRNQTLDGGNVLPGFTLSLDRLFAHADKKSRRRK